MMKLLEVPLFLLFCLVVPAVRFVAWLAIPKQPRPRAVAPEAEVRNECCAS